MVRSRDAKIEHMATASPDPDEAGGIFRLAFLHLKFLALLVAFMAALGSGVLLAQGSRLEDRVTDETGVLEDIEEIEDALRELEDEHSVQLWVLFVETTDPLPVTEFVDEVAAANSFGGNDALLVVAIDDRSDALWVSDSLDEVTNDEIDQLLTEELEPRLGDDEFDQAVIALASSLGEAATGDIPSGGQTDGGSTSSDGGGSGGTILLVILGLIVVGGAVFFFVRRSKKKQVQAGREEEADELSKQANGLLLVVDDELRDAEQEMGFAEAQFGDAEVKPFRAALERARGELKSAFAARQLLDDDQPETTEQRAELLRKIITHSEGARAILVPERQRIEKLRDIERAAPDLLAGMPARIDELEKRLSAAETGYQSLTTYATAVWKSLEGNTIEAGKRLVFAREAAKAGQDLIASGKRPEAGAHARAAQAAIGEAVTLLDAVEHQVTAVSQAEAEFPAALAAAQADVVAARTAVEEQRTPVSSEGVARAAALLESARKQASASPRDPLAALKLAQEADSAADSVLASVRRSADQQARLEANFRSTAKRAHTAYTQASDYIESRRKGIGREARTRLAEAERHLLAARDLETVDLVKAQSEVEMAERLASDAFRLAQRDFESDRREASRSNVTKRSKSGGFDLDDLGVEDILGGVLGGILSSGLGKGPGFGGTGWGNYTGGKSSSKSSGGFKLPSAGGRSSGGGFKSSGRSGGGRSRGGRW